MIEAVIVPEHPEKITLLNVPSSYKEICVKVPGLRWDTKGEHWRMPVSWAGCLFLRHTFKDRLEVGESLNNWVAKELDERTGPANKWREELGIPDEEAEEWARGLYPHQSAGVQFLYTAKQGLLCDDMGLGKTRQAATAIMKHSIEGSDPFPVLVICPNSTKHSWKREFEEVWPGLEVTVVDGTVTKRRKQLKTPAHVYIMNLEAIRSHSRLAPYGNVALNRCKECGAKTDKIKESSCHVHMRELNFMDFGAVILDEAHRIKNPSSQTARAIKYATGDAPIRIAMTGTPLANNPDDLWSILNWLAPDEWPSRSKFQASMLDISFDIYGNQHVTGLLTARKEEFFKSFNPRMRRMSKDAVLKFLPPIVRETRYIEMPPKQAKAYNQMRDLMIAELDEEDALMVTSPMVRTMRMLQFASSYADLEYYTEINDDGEEETKVKVHLALPSNKVDAFMTDLDDYEGRQVVVFAASKQLINLLASKLESADKKFGLITGDIGVDERQEYMDEFQKGNLQFMLCTVQAGGTGITLTAADTAVFLQRPWSMIDSKQAEARVHRIGSEVHDSITIIDYVSGGTLDETVIEALEEKAERLEEILRDRELLKRILRDPKANV